jgi:hypothetical protein
LSGDPPTTPPSAANGRNDLTIAYRIVKDTRDIVPIDRRGKSRDAQVFADKSSILTEIATGVRSAAVDGNSEQLVEVSLILLDLFFALLACFLTLFVRELPTAIDVLHIAGRYEGTLPVAR